MIFDDIQTNYVSKALFKETLEKLFEHSDTRFQLKDKENSRTVQMIVSSKFWISTYRDLRINHHRYVVRVKWWLSKLRWILIIFKWHCWAKLLIGARHIHEMMIWFVNSVSIWVAQKEAQKNNLNKVDAVKSLTSIITCWQVEVLFLMVTCKWNLINFRYPGDGSGSRTESEHLTLRLWISFIHLISFMKCLVGCHLLIHGQLKEVNNRHYWQNEAWPEIQSFWSTVYKLLIFHDYPTI